MLGCVYHPNLLWAGYSRDSKMKYNIVRSHLLPKQVFVHCVIDWTVLNRMGCAETIEEMLEIKVIEMGGNEEVFSSEAWRRAFDINEPIYMELCHEFFSTFKFNKEVTGEELTKKKIIRFRLGGRAHFRSLLEFARHLGLYNVRKFWRKVFKFTFKEFVTKLGKKLQLLTNEILDRLTALIFFRSLDATTLTEMIEPDGRLIAEDPAPGVPRFSISRPLRLTL
ncbi:hypothetical protein Tco_0201350 [Tanacetum coccineum]